MKFLKNKLKLKIKTMKKSSDFLYFYHLIERCFDHKIIPPNGANMGEIFASGKGCTRFQGTFLTKPYSGSLNRLHYMGDDFLKEVEFPLQNRYRNIKVFNKKVHIPTGIDISKPIKIYSNGNKNFIYPEEKMYNQYISMNTWLNSLIGEYKIKESERKMGDILHKQIMDGRYGI